MPGYSVPGSVPETWLTRTPPIPLGTTTMASDGSSRTQAASAHRAANDQRGITGRARTASLQTSVTSTATATPKNPIDATSNTYLSANMGPPDLVVGDNDQ